jgi:hypothetical protein
MSATHLDIGSATHRDVGSATRHDAGLDSGAQQLKPVLVAIMLAAVTTVIALAVAGLPH